MVGEGAEGVISADERVSVGYEGDDSGEGGGEDGNSLLGINCLLVSSSLCFLSLLAVFFYDDSFVLFL